MKSFFEAYTQNQPIQRQNDQDLLEGLSNDSQPGNTFSLDDAKAALSNPNIRKIHNFVRKGVRYEELCLLFNQNRPGRFSAENSNFNDILKQYGVSFQKLKETPIDEWHVLGVKRYLQPIRELMTPLVTNYTVYSNPDGDNVITYTGPINAVLSKIV